MSAARCTHYAGVELSQRLHTTGGSRGGGDRGAQLARHTTDSVSSSADVAECGSSRAPPQSAVLAAALAARMRQSSLSMPPSPVTPAQHW